MNILFIVFIIFLGLQRILELRLAKRNENIVRNEGAVEYDAKGYRYIVFLHIAFFISLFTEKFLLSRGLNALSMPLFIILILTQLLRYWAITSLGKYWNTKILVARRRRTRAGARRSVGHANHTRADPTRIRRD